MNAPPVGSPKADLSSRSIHAPIVEKEIKLRKQDAKSAAALVASRRFSELAARVLAARGYTPGPELDRFLEATLKAGVDSPDKLMGLSEAAELLASNIDAGIGVCCDFDVDGLSGGAQLASFLSALKVPFEVFVPDRFEDGYGLNEKMVHAIVSKGFKVLVCVDYGTTSVKELTLARAKGLKTVVVDHHHVESKPPPCDVFINPQQRGCGFAGKTLCASGLVWYLVMRLRRVLENRLKESGAKIETRDFLELACLGTVCDLVPLVQTNRVIAKKGLEALTHTARPGLTAMKKLMGVTGEVSCFDVSFGIGPRINAAGRMVNGSSVIELLTTQDAARATEIAKQLHELNAERQEAEAFVKDAALEVLRDRGDLPAGVVVWREDFHTGVIGIVAQRLVEMFYRPSIVLGADKDGVFKGSVRGVKGFSVVGALSDCGEFLIKYGGHEAAGGLSVHEENLESFAMRFAEICVERLGEAPRPPVAEADTVAQLSEVSIHSVNELKSFAPFGMGNPTPTVLLEKMRVQSLKVLKDAHLKIILSQGTGAINAFMWRRTEHPLVREGSVVDVVCKLDINTFQGNESVQATVEAVRAAAGSRR
jgi:single-stranded-DNA-specific exonuclease